MNKPLLSILFSFLLSVCSAQTWSPVGSGTTFGQVESMCVYNGELYVGGYFNSMGGIPVNSLARWNGTTWDSVPGMSGFGQIEITDMVVWQNRLIVVGNQIHGWDGTTWSNLGGWVNAPQMSVEVFINELYITGRFTDAAGVPTRGIAKWNGVQWDSVGGAGLNSSPGYIGRALQTYNGELFLGGEFYSVNGAPINGVATWDGMVWDSVGNSQSTYYISCFANRSNRIYAGGRMLIDNSWHWIGSWDGQVWDSLGIDFNSEPRAMSEYNGELYVVGDFDSAGQQPALGIARWNDTVWNSVGTGLDLMNINIDTVIIGVDTFYYPQEFLFASCVYNNELYVGGFFSMIGGVPANSIAKWHDVGATVEEAAGNNSPNVFPNPASEMITFQFSDARESRSIIIYDQIGREVWREESRENFVSVSVVEFSDGIYFYTIPKDDGSVCTGKFLIEH